ncbi:hypothetical protein PMAYCL1PPCAC_00572 [Pristionchus mayeri]|uniref:Uncharacterized protein n=1 Tax=Pristionchus mayeri TaxID=1317129 RepID=A0AAN5C545_9BILA|nr:hypothetical protein PMAYCL1PPCAC_00572 [Pristionchus mayeri]
MDTAALAKGCMEICELCLADKRESIERMSGVISVIQTTFTNLEVEQKDLVFDELARQLNLKKFLFCTLCNRFMFGARHMFMHMANDVHIDKSIQASPHFATANKLMQIMVEEWRMEKIFEDVKDNFYKKVNAHRKKWPSTSLNDSILRPLGDASNHMIGLERLKECKKLPQHLNQEMENLSNSDNPEAWMAVIDKTAGVLMKLLDLEIGEALTRCYECKLIFGNRLEYYSHLLTYYHVSMAKTFDLNTLVINHMMRHIAHMQPWPERTSQTPATAAQEDLKPETADGGSTGETSG